MIYLAVSVTADVRTKHKRKDSKNAALTAPQVRETSHEQVHSGGQPFLAGLMVKDGYLPFPLNQQHPASPVLDWNNRYKDEWVFEFTRHVFALTVSDHVPSKALNCKCARGARLP